jgi:hypothetical protein
MITSAAHTHWTDIEQKEKTIVVSLYFQAEIVN